MYILNYLIIGIKTIIILPFHLMKYFLIGLWTIISFAPHFIKIGLTFLIFNKKENNDFIKIEKKIIPITILTLSVTTYLLSIFVLTRWFVQNQRTKNFTNNFTDTIIIESQINTDITNEYQDNINDTNQTTTLNESTTQNNSNVTNSSPSNIINSNFINVNLNSYIQKNSETVAWIKVNGTKVNYPVVQHSNNDFYLEHDFYKRKTKNGWIFGDYRNDFEAFNNNTIIYGHNLINGSMFGTIPKLLNKNWFVNKNNHYIKLSTKNTNTVWQIFSIYKITPTTDYLQTRFNSTTTYQEFLNTLKNRSKYQFNLNVNYTDKILTLSTCDNSGTKRVAIHAKLINIESK